MNPNFQQQQPAAPSAAGPLQSSRVSLISKSEIRYEGTLHSINPTENTVALRNVRMFGTEGRKNDGPQIPAADQLYEFIIFRGSDIKDLTVYDVTPTPPPASSQMPPDPAIISSNVWANQGQGGGQAPPMQQQMPQMMQQQQGGWDRPQGRGGMGGGRGWEDRGGGYGGGGYGGGGGGYGGQQRRPPQQQHQQQWQQQGGRGGQDRRTGHTGQDFRAKDGQAKPQEFEKEYDFESSNKKAAEMPAEEEGEKPTEIPKYDQGKSFFDDLSAARPQIGQDQGPRMTRHQRRQQDLETFGDISLNEEVGYGYGGARRGGFQQQQGRMGGMGGMGGMGNMGGRGRGWNGGRG